jgi:hypothetical protein
MELKTLQQSFMSYLLGESQGIVNRIESTPMRSAKGRMDIYANAYRMRLKEAMATDFDKLHSYLGDEQFGMLMDTYIDTYPSHTTSLRYFSNHVPELLEQAPFNELPVLKEIAVIERAFADSFDAKDLSVTSIDDLAQIQPESWAFIQLDLQKSLQIIPFSFNSFSIWKALSDEQTPPPVEKMKNESMWVLWRKSDLISHYRHLSDAEAAALNAAQQGATFAMICEVLLDYFTEEETPVKAVTMLQSWLQEEMVAAIGLAEEIT